MSVAMYKKLRDRLKITSHRQKTEGQHFTTRLQLVRSTDKQTHLSMSIKRICGKIITFRKRKIVKVIMKA